LEGTKINPALASYFATHGNQTRLKEPKKSTMLDLKNAKTSPTGRKYGSNIRTKPQKNKNESKANLQRPPRLATDPDDFLNVDNVKNLKTKSFSETSSVSGMLDLEPKATESSEERETMNISDTLDSEVTESNPSLSKSSSMVEMKIKPQKEKVKPKTKAKRSSRLSLPEVLAEGKNMKDAETTKLSRLPSYSETLENQPKPEESKTSIISDNMLNVEDPETKRKLSKSRSLPEVKTKPQKTKLKLPSKEKDSARRVGPDNLSVGDNLKDNMKTKVPKTKSVPEIKLNDASLKLIEIRPSQTETGPQEILDGENVRDNKFWGFVSTRHKNRVPDVHLPKTYSMEITNDAVKQLGKEDENTATLGTSVLNTVSVQSHRIPDPYNAIPYPENEVKIQDPTIKNDKIELPVKATPYTFEPPHGLRSLFSPDMAKIISKNQAQVKQIEVDRAVVKSAQVEYEIYQKDYRIPKYRFYKQYKEYIPDDFVKETENWVPCANCFDSRDQAARFNLAHKLEALSEVKKDREVHKKEQIEEYGKGPIFNRIFSCLCGNDNEAGHRVPGWKPVEREEDDTDLDHFFEAPDYRKKKK
jgi:hypothetical protein